jgi:hypothetical protein
LADIGTEKKYYCSQMMFLAETQRTLRLLKGLPIKPQGSQGNQETKGWKEGETVVT